MSLTTPNAEEERFGEAYFAANYRDYARQNPRRKLSFYRQVVEAALMPGAPRRIHDMGCGFGLFLASLDDAWERYGSDVSAFALERAKSACPRGVFQQGGADDRSPFSVPFGVVTAFDVIEHVPDLESVGREVAPQLADGGSFVFVVPVYDGLSGPIIRRMDHDPTHVHKWPREAWLSWASQRFEIVDWLGIVRWLTPGGYYLHVVTRWMRKHTPAILVVCRKRGTSC